MIHQAVILSTGDELVTGRVVDTNSTVIADELGSAGIRVAAVLKVGDDKEKLLWALRHADALGDAVIGTGGLGPTADDLTTEVVALFLGTNLKQDDSVARSLRERFASRGLSWTENNLKQALFPDGATIIPNPVGTAPGFRVQLSPGKTLFWLSGVPQEMAAMLKQSVIPWLIQARKEAEGITSCTFKLNGLTESKLDDLLRPVTLGAHARLSFRTHYPELSLRLSVFGGEEREEIFERLRHEIRRILGAFIYAESDKALEEIVGELLQKHQRTLSLAESCTGGYISHRITRVAGSSAYFMGSAVTYSNEAKVHFLGVHPETLERYGAVSRETALQMSTGIKQRSRTTYGLSVTGIAGPAGGTADKPVGTVWISIAGPEESAARLFHFHGERERIILGASQAALDWLRRALEEQTIRDIP
ncbi:MAG: competence/damage-inducible protein A [Candidatus Binatia bacterium]